MSNKQDDKDKNLPVTDEAPEFKVKAHATIFKGDNLIGDDAGIKPAASALVTVHILHPSPLVDGDDRLLCATLDDTRAFLVPESKVTMDMKAKFAITPTDIDIVEVYNWGAEIDKLLVTMTRENLAKNIRLSLWLSGSIKPGELKRNAMRRAFPYQIE